MNSAAVIAALGIAGPYVLYALMRNAQFPAPLTDDGQLLMLSREEHDPHFLCLSLISLDGVRRQRVRPPGHCDEPLVPRRCSRCLLSRRRPLCESVRRPR